MPQEERHPFEPFLPEGARLLMLGTFPPAPKRWCMSFYYPNYLNDMWRIVGLCYFSDKNRFVDEQSHRFRLDSLIPFLTEQGIALYDTATVVRRTTGTASDKDLEIVVPTDLDALLARLPRLCAVVTAGQLATTLFCRHFDIPAPRVGEYSPFSFQQQRLRLYRMPSSSRAYPMKPERKAIYYNKVFEYIQSIKQ